MQEKDLPILESKNNLTVSRKKEHHLVESLLERPITDDYKKEWTNILMKYQEQLETTGTISVVIFRLFQDWLALPTIFFKEILQQRSIHRIPHRTGKVLLGIVNLEGKFQLCVNLSYLLQLNSSLPSSTLHNYHHNRMIAIQKENDLWVFPVDEIEGIDNWDYSLIENVPNNISRSTHNYLKGIMNKGYKSIGLLDEELLFYSLRRSLA